MTANKGRRGRALVWIPLLIVSAVAGAVAGGYGVHRYERAEAPPPGDVIEPSEALDKVVALGRIEPRDGVLSLGVPTPDRIARLLVHEGDTVRKGQDLAVLDSAVNRELEKKQAEIQLEQGKKRLAAVKASGNAQVHVEEARRAQVEQVEPIELRALESKIKFLEAQEKNAHKDYERYVAAGDTIAQQDREKQKLAQNQVHAELIAARCQHEKLLKTRELNRLLADAQIEAARAELKRGESAISPELLEQQVIEADERLKESQVRAPSDGKVLRIIARQGELVHGQPILQMADVRHMIVLTEVYETDIPRVEVGQKATVTSHIFKQDQNALTGRVVWKAGSVGKARVVPLDPRAAVDNRVVDVKVELDQPHRASDLIGHQVRVIIQTGPASGGR